MIRDRENREPVVSSDIELERYEFFEGPLYQFELDRRDFLKVLGGGILVCLVAGDAIAQQPGRRGGRGGGPSPIGAWIHIAENGQITAFTGKVELGQNARTSLTQAVAEELRVPVSAVKMVMADTDLVPFDMGTFGSQTTPQMVPQIRRAAATAREALLDVAAEQAKIDRSSLSAADGKVMQSGGKGSWTFGELSKGQKLTKMVTADVALTPTSQWKVEGTSVPKVDALSIVTGKHRYSSDITRPGMLYGKVLRPVTLNSKLDSVDLKGAEAVAGVMAVHDGNFVGVAAPSVFVAEQALAAIKADWKTPENEPTDKDLFEQLKRPSAGGGRGGGGEGLGGRGGGNLGSIEKGIAAADHKVQATYTIAYIAHTPLEPRAAVAEWNDGKLTVWTGTQRPFGVKSDIAQAFGLAQEKVRVIVPDTGSGYGGKHTGEAAIEAARLAKATGKPVKVVWTREEEFTWAYFRPAGVIEVNAGVDKFGKITFWEFHNYNSGGSAIRPMYDIANLKTETHQSRSPLRQGSYRALAATANHFARESHIDDLAHAAGIDPLEFRLKNLKDTRFIGVLKAAAEEFGWGKPAPAGRGVGIAGGFEKGSYVATCAEVEIDKMSGQVNVTRAVAAFDCGAVLNPDHLKNQIEGSVVMGLGGALFEAIKFDGGKIKNASFSKYRLPRFSDAPEIKVVLVDRKDLPSSGAGETPIVGIAPAVGNAIFQATGTRLRSMPMVPNGLKA